METFFESGHLATDKLKFELQPEQAGRVPGLKFAENLFDLPGVDIQ